MRISALTVLALVSFASLAARAEDAALPAPNAEQPAVPAGQKSASEAAPSPAAESKSDKQLSAEARSEKLKDADTARFGFQRVDDGFLRFDYQTGQVAFCNPASGAWGCQPVPENRAALAREVEQLRAEMADLKNQLKGLTEPPRPVPPETVPPSKGPNAAPPKADKGDLTFSIPGREHFERAATAVQEAWQHFVDLVIGLTNDIRRKSGA